MPKTDHIYKVLFREPPTAEGKTEYYFTSLAAIYNIFTPQQVGCAVNHLYNVGVSNGTPYSGRRTVITRERLVSKDQTNPRQKKSTL